MRFHHIGFIGPGAHRRLHRPGNAAGFSPDMVTSPPMMRTRARLAAGPKRTALSPTACNRTEDGFAPAIQPSSATWSSSAPRWSTTAPVSGTAGRPCLKPGALLTDVGQRQDPASTRRSLQPGPARTASSAATPWRARKRRATDHSSDHLLENAYYILTPPVGADVLPALWWSSRNSRAVLTVAPDHRRYPHGDGLPRSTTAWWPPVSHLPHLIAAALVNLVRDSRHSADGHHEDRSRPAASRISPASPPPPGHVAADLRDQHGGPIAEVLERYIRLHEPGVRDHDPCAGQCAGDLRAVCDLPGLRATPLPSGAPRARQKAGLRPVSVDVVDQAGAIASHLPPSWPPTASAPKTSASYNNRALRAKGALAHRLLRPGGPCAGSRAEASRTNTATIVCSGCSRDGAPGVARHPRRK